MQRLDEAEAALRRALALEPNRLDYLYALAEHLMRRGRLEEAGTLADRMIEYYPDQRVGYHLKREIGSR